MGLWSDNMKNRIIAEGGSIQNVPSIPDEVKALYKTVWEISQRTVVQMAADRGAFIDQSQSLNIHMREPTMGKITSMHFTGWKLGLKTGMYYLRTQSAANPIQFTVDQEALLVQETSVARAAGPHGLRKRTAPPGSGYSSVPRPMSMLKNNSDVGLGTGVSSAFTPSTTPSTTPPPSAGIMTRAGAAPAAKVAVPRPVASPSKAPPFKADQDDSSPKVLPNLPDENLQTPLEILGEPALDDEKPAQTEDAEHDNKEREKDIYSEAVLACKWRAAPL